MSFTENNLFYDKGNSKSIWDINNKIPNLLKTLEKKVPFTARDGFILVQIWYYPLSKALDFAPVLEF